MADENIVTNIVAKADFSNLIADLNKVSFSLSKLQDQLVASNKMLAAQVGVMNRSFADTLRSTGQYSTHFVSLTSDVDKFGSQLDKGQMKLGKFFQVYRQHASTSGGLVRDLAKQQVQLQNAIMQPLGKNAQGLMQYNVHIPRGLDLIKNKSLIARQELQIMNKVVQEGANSLINWGKNTQWAGRQLTVGLTVPLAAFGKASADAFRQADEQLVRLTKVYGGVAATSSQELGKVRADVSKTAEDLAKSYGAAFKDTLALAADIAATGKQGNDLLGAIKETTRLAVLGEVDRQDAMKATLAIQTAFKQNTDELSESINFLNAVENQTSTTLNDLVEAIPKAGPIIQGLGGSVQDLALYLTAMREGGINASEGANALKSALASLINPTNVAVEKFSGFGIDLLGIVNNNAGDVTATLMSLQAALDKLNPLQKQQSLEQLFGKFQFARMNALFENLGRQGSQTLQVLDLMKASSQDLASLAGRELSAVTESASGKYRRAVEGLKADLAGIGEQFLKINTSLINFVDGIIKFVQKLPDPIKQVLGFMGLLTATAGPLIMLTGVLGNFFGYIIKGAYHFKSLFKGGEGWKLLTPEILAAQKAGNLVEQTFYSDAKAAAVLKQAIAGLTAEFTILQQKASSAAMSVNPGISTLAGGAIVAGQRVVNPNNPLAGAVGTRAAGHHIPRSQMSEKDRLSQTIHSFTPVPIPLNQKIGATPQIFTEGDLPRIPGLTVSGGASTGIVAGEAAKWHALMGTLSMLTKREVTDLKKEIARTGTFSTEINTTFGKLLPAMTDITSNAATQSAAIVAQLQAGKITVEAARAKIIAINAQLEAMMAQTTAQVAADLGRTANLTQVPLINQPIVSGTGKANIKELFRAKRPSAGIIDKIARTLGVRTFGAGYSTETTIPKLASGGMVVPGPRSDTTDTQFMNLTEGDIVLNRKASDALMGYNNGGKVVPAMVTPGEIVINNPTPSEAKDLLAYNNQFATGGTVMNSKNNYGIISLAQLQRMRPTFTGKLPSYKAKSTAGTYIGDVTDLNIVNKYGTEQQIQAGRISRRSINGSMTEGSVAGPVLKAAIKSGQSKVGLLGSGDQFLRGLYKAGIISKQQYKYLSRQIKKKYFKYLDRSSAVGDSNNDYNSIVSRVLNDSVIDKKGITLWQKFSKQVGAVTSANTRSSGTESSRSTNAFKIEIDGVNFGSLEARGSGALFAHATPSESFRNEISQTSINRPRGSTIVADIRAAQQSRYNREDAGLLEAMYANSGGRVRLNNGGMVGGRIKMNRGGMASMPPALPIPPQNGKYNMGGMVPGVAYMNQGGGPVSAFTEGLRNPYGKSAFVNRQMPKMGMGTSLGIGMGGMLAGQMVGGSAGSAIMVASSIASMIPMFGGLSKGIGIVTKLASVLGKLTIPGALIGSLAFVVKLILDAKNNAEDLGKANRLAFGGTQESFASVGITKFKTLSDRLKEVNEQIELNKAKAQSAYEAYTKGGPTGITLSIAELNEAIENAKKNQTEYIEAFNNIDSSGVNKYAADLKAQFVAMGLSASEASNQIFAMVKASEKAGQALSAVTTSDFRNIIDQTTALTRLFDNLGKASTINNFNTEEFATGLDTLVNSVIAYQEGLVKIDKIDPSKSVDAAKALQMTMEKIGKIDSSRATLNIKQVENLKQQNIVYASILKDVESLESITAKILLYNNELGRIVDFSAMSGPDAITMATNYSEILNGVNKITQDLSTNNPLKSFADVIDKARKTSVGYENSIKSAKKQDEEYYSKKIKAIDLEIKKIREAADARRKALQEQQNAESYATEIKKLQLDYQNKLAAGDLAGAARAQLDIQQLTKEKQTRDAISAIDKKEAEDLKKKEAEKEKIRAQEEAFKKGVQVAVNKSAEASINVANLEKNLDRLEKLSIMYASSTNSKTKQEFAKEAQSIIFAMKSGTKEEKQIASNIEKQSMSKNESLNIYGAPIKGQQSLNLYGPAQETTGQKVLNEMQKEIERKGILDEVFGKAVTDFKKAVDNFKGSTGIKQVSTNYNPTRKYGAPTNTEFKDLIAGENLKEKDIFEYQGKTYEVKKDLLKRPYATAYKKAMGGYIRNYDMGSIGGVRGPGTGTSDSIPAMLSNGEYVLRASAVNAVGVPLLDEINKMAMGGLAARYDVSKKSIMPASTMGYNKGGQIQHYNVGGLTMNFANGGEVNGRMVYEQFKSAMALEQLKSGGGGKLR